MWVGGVGVTALGVLAAPQQHTVLLDAARLGSPGVYVGYPQPCEVAR